MKRVMFVGAVACGKTTLCQWLNGMDRRDKKTQTIEIINWTIDTPGEYLEHRSYLQSLMVTSVDADAVLFVQDPTRLSSLYSPGQAGAFPIPAAGVVSKIDLAGERERAQARQLLELTGVERIFEVSAVSGEGMEELARFLAE